MGSKRSPDFQRSRSPLGCMSLWKQSMNTSPNANDPEFPNANAGSSQMWSFYAKYPERFCDSIVKLAYAFRVAEHYLMKRGVSKAAGGGHQKRRKTVAQILRASYERF